MNVGKIHNGLELIIGVTFSLGLMPHQGENAGQRGQAQANWA